MKFKDIPEDKFEEFINSKKTERVETLKNVLIKRQYDLTVVLENIQDPHNMMACLRSCDAVGISDVYIINNKELARKPIQKQKIGKSSSASAKKWLNLNRFKTVNECYEKLRSEDKQIFTTNLTSDSKSLYEMDLTGKIALVFGNEAKGVSKEATDLADGNFNIPQVGMIPSLNISVACAVTVFEAFRQKSLLNHYSINNLSEIELNKKLVAWLYK
jgi:tRNA (guanosine-2'-O-)-methyltransferase